ncbi:uncharacterized protein SCHCODRAFT_02480378, partial [Schizophyllum commune H4-8]|uniref:uncharacterized protein n=1 Tax=Schizophyllum commune (strain H4-8 / FGSC 9210) TaxID=578458 RepID=UPI0021601EA0
MMVTGLNTRHTGERFQHSHTTISYYFCIVLDAVSSPPFYTKHVQLPKDGDQPHSYLHDNPNFWPFFEGCDSAVDGSHIASAPTARERHSHRDRK